MTKTKEPKPEKPVQSPDHSAATLTAATWVCDICGSVLALAACPVDGKVRP